MNSVELLKKQIGSADCGLLLTQISNNIVIATCAEALFKNCIMLLETEKDIEEIEKRLNKNDKFDNRDILSLSLNALVSKSKVLTQDIDDLSDSMYRDYKASVVLIKEILL
jgi:hypothetical protein